MRTAGFCPPLMLTRPTPDNCEIFWARCVSAKSWTLDSGSVCDVSARVSTGASAGLNIVETRGICRAPGQKTPTAVLPAWGTSFAQPTFRVRGNQRAKDEHAPARAEG